MEEYKINWKQRSDLVIKIGRIRAGGDFIARMTPNDFTADIQTAVYWNMGDIISDEAPEKPLGAV